MELGISAGIHIRQELKANPRLYQQMNLLNMPLLDLRTHLNEELVSNPFLEMAEPGEDFQNDEVGGHGDGDGEQIDWEEVLRDGFEVGSRATEYEEKEYFTQIPAATRDLWDHLSDQLRLIKLEERRVLIGEEIIGNIDADGFLTCTLDLIVESLNKHLSDPAGFWPTVLEEDEEPVDFAPISIAEVEEMLEIIQNLEPSGIGARDPREALLLQQRDRGKEDTLAFKLVRDHFNDLVNHRWKELSKEHGVTPQEVQAAADEVAKLDPKPGLKYSNSSSSYVIPDLIVEKIDGEYCVSHNDTTLPRLKLSSSYREVVAQPGKFEGENKAFITERLNKARSMIQAVEQRRQTMLKIMHLIVERQQDFFEKGEEHLRPLAQREVADHVEMHESTVSRFANKKYVQTPRGVLPLKFFFSGGLPTDYGDDVSNRGVRLQIKKIVSKEDPKAPFTDPQIVDLLRKDGIQIARRTVAKYRDELGLLSARLRKRV